MSLASRRASGSIASKVQAERAKSFGPSDRRGLPKAKVRRAAAPPPHADPNVVTDLPERIPLIREQLAIWRAFLSAEIDAIMRDNE